MKRLLLSISALLIFTGCSNNNLTLTQNSFPINNNVSTQSYQGVKKGVIELRKIRFSKWDNNKDWILDRSEVTDNNLYLPGDIITGFDDYDKNKDGLINLQEFLRDDVIHWWMEQYRPILEDEFFIHDNNNDGVIAGNSEREDTNKLFSPKPELNGGDLDNNGVITYSEFEDSYMAVYPLLDRRFLRSKNEKDILPKSRK